MKTTSDGGSISTPKSKKEATLWRILKLIQQVGELSVRCTNSHVSERKKSSCIIPGLDLEISPLCFFPLS